MGGVKEANDLYPLAIMLTRGHLNLTDSGNVSASAGTDPWELFIHTTGAVFVPIIVITGLFGNTLSLMVFATPAMRRTPCSVFLGALSAADNTFLTALLLTWIDGEVMSFLTSDIACQLIIYLTYIASFLSVWFIVGFTCERYIAVCHPLRRPRLCSVYREKITVAALTVWACLMYNYSFWTTGFEQLEPQPRCYHKLRFIEFLNVITWFDTFLTMIIPFIIIIVVNISVLRKIYISRNKSNNSFNADNTRGSSRSTALLYSCRSSLVLVRHDRSRQPRNGRTYNGSPHVRVTRTVLCVSLTFLLLNLPSHVIRLYR